MTFGITGDTRLMAIYCCHVFFLLFWAISSRRFVLDPSQKELKKVCHVYIGGGRGIVIGPIHLMGIIPNFKQTNRLIAWHLGSDLKLRSKTVPWHQANLQDAAWLQGEPDELAQYKKKVELLSRGFMAKVRSSDSYQEKNIRLTFSCFKSKRWWFTLAEFFH